MVGFLVAELTGVRPLGGLVLLALSHAITGAIGAIPSVALGWVGQSDRRCVTS